VWLIRPRDSMTTVISRV